jgi:hypothetical protein
MVRPKGGRAQTRHYYYKNNGTNRLIKLMENPYIPSFYNEKKAFVKKETFEELIQKIKNDLVIIKNIRKGIKPLILRSKNDD